ncbi:MAG: hypothetical protein IJ275_01885 [Ruminococcus sp.]|nr:hypothetical protein [Ruminococcus sp.]
MVNDTIMLGFEMMQKSSPLYPVFEYLVHTTIYITITALLIILFKSIFKNKIGAKWHVLIWLVLLIRLAVPVLPSSPLSIFNKAQIEDDTIASMTYSVVENNDNVNTVKAYNVEKGTVEDYNYGEENAHADYNASRSDSDTGSIIRLDVAVITVWIAGGMFLISYLIFVYFRYIQNLKKSKRTCDDETYEAFKHCKEKLSIKRDVELFTADTTPVLMGLFQPEIYIPEGHSKTETEYTLLHELNHLKNYDILWTAVATLVLCMNWFNPIVWISFFMFKRDIEVYCDERTLKHTENKSSYAQLLFDTATEGKYRFVLGTTSFQNGKSGLKHRIKYMAKYKKPTVLTATFALVLLSAILVVCLTNSMSGKVNFTLENPINYCKIDLIIDRDIVGNNYRDNSNIGRFYSNLDIETIAKSICVDNLDKCSYEMVIENEALLRINDDNIPFVLISKKVQDEWGNKLDDVVIMECLGNKFHVDNAVSDDTVSVLENGLYFPVYLIEECRYTDFGKSFSVTGSSPFSQKIILKKDENNLQKLVDFYGEMYLTTIDEKEDGSGELTVYDTYSQMRLFSLFYNAEDRSVSITDTYTSMRNDNAKSIVQKFENSIQRGDITAAKKCFVNLSKQDEKCIENLPEDFNLAFAYVEKLDINSRFEVATLYVEFVDSKMIEYIVNFEVELIDGEFKITNTDLVESLKNPFVRSEEVISQGVIDELDLSDIEGQGFVDKIASIIYADEKTVILDGECGLVVYNLVEEKIELRVSVDYLRGLGYDFPYALASPDGTEVYIYESTGPSGGKLTDTMVGHTVTINVEDKTFKRDNFKNRDVFNRRKLVKEEMSVEQRELYGINWLSSSSIYVEVGDKIMFTQCTPNWLWENLQLVICDRDTGEKEVIHIFDI